VAREETKRLLDPIHGLIVFDQDDKTDMLAWQLINTPEFQRLRRIKQLGVGELVFPGATHNRFAHSIGVYHNARKLMKVIQREVDTFDQRRAQIILLAALLHDIGHGPFSHGFENASRTVAESNECWAYTKHEKISAELIQAESGTLRKVLDEHDAALAEQIAAVIAAEDPTDIYHAVVSSSFDADRLDYLLRDRYMTGTGTGSIDYGWLMDNLTTYIIHVSQDDDEPRQVPTFVFKNKARQAAEDFLLARYRLYAQVYLHKTTRGFEKLASALFKRLANKDVTPDSVELDPNHPLMRFFSPEGGTLDDFRRLDDTVVWGAIECMTRGKDPTVKVLAERLLHRQRLAVLDLATEYGHESEARLNAEKRLDDFLNKRIDTSVFKDKAQLSLYSRSDGEMEPEHKKVRVLTGNGEQRDIIEFEDTIISKRLMNDTALVRYYFLDDGKRDKAMKVMKGR